MPMIPRQTNQTVFTEGVLPSQRIDAEPADFGALQAGAMQRVGQNLAQAGQETTQTVMLQQQYANESSSTQALNAFQSKADDLLNGNPQAGVRGYTTLEGRDAVDQQQNYQTQIMGAFNASRDSLNPAAQRMFDMMGHWALRSAMSRLGSHAAQQQVSYNYRQARASVALNQQAALTGADDAHTWTNALAATQDASLRSSKILGLDGDAAEAQRRSDLSQIYVQRTEQLAQRDPTAAADFYQKNIGMVAPAQRYALSRMLQTTTDAQYSRADGLDAFRAAIGRTVNNSPLPTDVGANFVKPYDDKQIASIVQQVKAPSPYDATIDQVAKQYNLNPTELKLRLTAESGLNPKAVSPQGAVGIAQLMPDTAKALGVDPTNPEASIDAAARLMVKAGDTVGNTDPSAADRLYYGGATDAKGPNTDQYVDNLRAVRVRLFGPSAPAPMTAADLEGREADVITQAKAFAERRRPGDLVYQDQVVAEAQKNWARDVQSLRNQEYANTSGVLDAVVKGNIQSPSELPPDMLRMYSQLTPQNMESVQAQMVRNQRQASGEFTPSNPGLFNSLQSRLYLPQGDPNRITDPSQITPYIAHGLSYSDSQRLMTEMKEYNSPSANPFLRQANQVKLTAMRMLQTSLNATALTHPELTQESAYRFDYALDQDIAALRKQGKDPSILFDPTNPDYVLKPARVLSFLPSESSAAGAVAHGPATSVAGAAPPSRQPGESPAAYLARVQFQGNP